MRRHYLLLTIVAIVFLSVRCQPDYYEENTDIPTETIDFKELTVSKDTAWMYDTIVIKAIAEGENVQYKWQKNGGSLVLTNDPSIAYFWGCPTCIGWLTISCTVFNSYGSYTKDVDVYILSPWSK